MKNPKFIVVKGVEIAYFEKNPDMGNTIFFIHGNSLSSSVWSGQFEADCLSDFRLISFDLPAHGKSGSFSGTALDYDIISVASIMAEAIVQLADTGKFMIIGLSLGTNIIAEMLAHGIFPAGICLIGSCLLGGNYSMEKVFQPDAYMRPAFTVKATEQELLRYWNNVVNTSSDFSVYQTFAQDYYAVKDDFRSRMFATVAEGKLNDQINLLEESGIPAMVIFGSEELVCNKNYLDSSSIKLWNNYVIKVSGAGHFVPFDKPEELSILIKDFANDQFRQFQV